LLFDHVGECLTGSDGASINTWTDSSAAANNLTGGGGANIPIKKTAILNGWSVARLNGGGAFTLGTAFSGQSFTYIAVVLADNLAVVRPLLGNGSGCIELRVGTDGKIMLLKSGVASIGASSTAMSLNTFYTVAVTYSSPNCAFYLNGSADGTASSAQTFSSNMIKIAESAVDGTIWHGDIAEELMWNTVLSGGDLTTVFNALRTRYAHY